MRFWNFSLQAQLTGKFFLAIMSGLLFICSSPAARAESEAESQVVYCEDGQLSLQLHMPLYQWSMRDQAPRAVVIAMHGLIMHGRAYESLARTLASQGFLVVATDMRGYGRCCQGQDHSFCQLPDCRQKIDYEKSYQDLASLAACLKKEYPTLPLIGLGESLGAAMAIRMCSEHAALLDGLILSAPAIKHHTFVHPYNVAATGKVIANPRAQLDLKPYMKCYASDDPRVISELENDPLVRKHLSFYELLQSSSAVRKTISYVRGISPDTPVLVIQGSADRCIKANAVVLLLTHLRSTDQTVKWFHERGHILLETAYIKPDTMEAVVGWLRQHVGLPEMQARESRNYVSTGDCRQPENLQYALSQLHGILPSPELVAY